MARQGSYQTAYEDDGDSFPAVSDADILAFVQANIGNPALIAETAAQYGVSVDDLSRATGYDANAVVSYFQQADVAPPAYEPPPTGGLSAVSVAEEPPPPPPPDEPIYEPPPPPEEPIYDPPPPPPPPPLPEKPVVETPVITAPIVDTKTADTSNAGNVLSGNILAGASWNSTNNTLGDQLTAATGQQTLNTAVDGATTADTLNQLNTFIDSGGSFAPGSTVFLQTGGVDMLQGIDDATITNNINQIVSTLDAQGVNVVLTASPRAGSVNDVVNNNFESDSASFYSDIAASNSNVAVVDSMGNILKDKSLLRDALHTNAAGEQVYNQSVIDAYNRLINKGVDSNTALTIAVEQADTKTTTGTTTKADATTPTATTAATTTATTPAATTATTAATTLPSITDYQGNQYDGAQILTLAQQIAQNAGSMTGGAFQTKGENIGFAATEANTLLGRTATASEQVLLDMARQMIQSGVTDLSQLQVQDITSSGVSVQIDPDTNQYYALIPSADGETSTRKELTADQVAKIKTQEVLTGGEGETSTYRTIDDLVTGKGLFANGKMLTAQDAVDNPIAYTIGATYTGGGGTSYDLKFDPKTGKSVVSANGFTTSDADTIMPIIMIASNFLLPGVGSMLTSTLVEAGMSEIVSQVVSKSIINGVTSGIMAEASGGDFGDGFLKGSITGAISAGVAPMISTALPSDLSPAVSSALTKAGTAAITALATGKDVGTAIGTQLLNSAVGTGLSSVTGEMGLSTADAKLLNSVLTPVVTQLVTNGNVNDATLMNAVLLAGSTILANTDSSSVGNVSTLTTGSDTDKVVGGLNLLATETGNSTLTDLASTVGTGLGAVSTATGLLNKATSLTNTPKTKVNKTRANLTGALTTTGKPTTRVTAVKPAALNTLNKPKTTTTAVKPAALGALSTAKKTLTSQQISQLKASKPPARVNVANLTAIKKPPQKVDVKTLIPVKTAQLPAGLNTKKMG